MILGSFIEEILCNRVVLYRQPIVSPHTGIVSHYEVLARLLEGEKHIPPSGFISELEEHNFVNLLDRRVITNLTDYLCSGNDSSIYAVNVSGQTINNDRHFIRFLKDALDRCNLKIMIEITESVPLEDSEIVRSSLSYFINEPRIELALDDFGSGYFGIYSLDLGCRFVKIHGDFTKRLPDPKAMTDIRAITEMAHERSSLVVLEWIEREEQKSWSKELGIDLIQGYLLGKPEPFIFPKPYCDKCTRFCRSNTLFFPSKKK